MNNSNIPCYVRSNIKGHNITAHIWVSPSLTKIECEVLELLVKGYSVTRISESRFRSVKTVSLQKHQIYKKLGIRNDITFWLDLSLSSCVKMEFTYKEGTVKELLLSDLNNVSDIAHNISCKSTKQESGCSCDKVR